VLPSHDEEGGEDEEDEEDEEDDISKIVERAEFVSLPSPEIQGETTSFAS
jgi:hypothetical protein